MLEYEPLGNNSFCSRVKPRADMGNQQCDVWLYCKHTKCEGIQVPEGGRYIGRSHICDCVDASLHSCDNT
eukprot:50512-Amphidinium_carterae.1